MKNLQGFNMCLILVGFVYSLFIYRNYVNIEMTFRRLETTNGRNNMKFTGMGWILAGNCHYQRYRVATFQMSKNTIEVEDTCAAEMVALCGQTPFMKIEKGGVAHYEINFPRGKFDWKMFYRGVVIE